MFQDPIQDTTLHLVIMSSYFSWLWQFFRFSLFLMTLTVLRTDGQVFCRMSLGLNLPDIFLMIRLGIWFGERKTTEVKCLFDHITSRAHTVNMTCHCWCWPWSPGWDSVCQVSPLKNYFSSPIFDTVPLGGSHYVQPTLKMWGILLCFLEGRISTYIIWNSSA